MQSALQNKVDDMSTTLASIREAALRFAAGIKGIPGAGKLVSFDPLSFFTSAAESTFEQLVESFLVDRTRGGIRPMIDAYDISQDFKKSIRVRDRDGLEALNVGEVLGTALGSLAEILPEHEAENTVNRQLADRAFSVLRLEYQEPKEKGGRTVLTYRAVIDSFTKKWKNRNDYTYTTSESIREQLVLIQELVMLFNAECDGCYSTLMPSWQEINNYGKHLSRSPEVVQVLGVELRCKVSAFEWHLPKEFSAFLSEFISLHRSR